jgi:hypothetical protein
MHEFTSVPMSIDPHASGRVEERLEFQVPGISKPFDVTGDLSTWRGHINQKRVFPST